MRRTRTKNQLSEALTALLYNLIHNKPGSELALLLLDTAERCQAYADEIDPRVRAHFEQQQP